MLRWLCPLLLTGLLNCTNPGLTPDGIMERRAILTGDSRPVDGCDAHLLLTTADTLTAAASHQRLPTPATRALMDKVVQAEAGKAGSQYWMGPKSVTIRYRETGQTATLYCGWGATRQISTIELVSIR